MRYSITWWKQNSKLAIFRYFYCNPLNSKIRKTLKRTGFFFTNTNRWSAWAQRVGLWRHGPSHPFSSPILDVTTASHPLSRAAILNDIWRWFRGSTEQPSLKTRLAGGPASRPTVWLEGRHKPQPTTTQNNKCLPCRTISISISSNESEPTCEVDQSKLLRFSTERSPCRD